MNEDMRILPHDLLAEQSVLGAIFIDPGQLVTVSEFVSAKDFYKPANKVIFETMLELDRSGEAIDAVTMQSALTSQNRLDSIGGLPYLLELVNSVPTSKNAEHYAKIVGEKALMRQVIAELSDSVSAAYGGDMSVEDVIARAEQSLVVAGSSRNKSTFRSVSEVVTAHADLLDQRGKMDSDVTGLATGFTAFDKITTGLHEDNLIILAARPAMGKTAFALNIAQNVALRGKRPVAVFSLEMNSESLVERMLAAEGMVESYHLRTGRLDEAEWGRLNYAQGELYKAPIYIDDTPGIRISEIRSRARKLAQEVGGLGLIVIDYLQLITGSRSDNRQQEVSEISRQLKIIAKELKVPVIALSQLSRGVESRQDKRPVLSDLRESGSIEQDADIVAFLYREAYYKREQADDEEENNLTELILEKNRHGSLGSVKLYFHKEYTKFSNVEEKNG